MANTNSVEKKRFENGAGAMNDLYALSLLGILSIFYVVWKSRKRKYADGRQNRHS